MVSYLHGLMVPSSGSHSAQTASQVVTGSECADAAEIFVHVGPSWTIYQQLQDFATIHIRREFWAR